MRRAVGHEVEIESILGKRTGCSCVYMPSGRLGIQIALAAWLSRGDRILMSPVNDDVVLFTVLAAGLRPVVAPLSPADGNIDPEVIPAGAWDSVRAVLSTNLYGLPDWLPELWEGNLRCENHRDRRRSGCCE